MKNKPIDHKTLQIAALFGFLIVAFGAFGAHALKLENKHQEWFDKAVFYQAVHTLLLLAMAFLPDLRWTKRFCIAGIILFSGSLYAMALGAPKTLGRITPLGGICFLLAWGGLFFMRLPEENTKQSAAAATNSSKDQTEK